MNFIIGNVPVGDVFCINRKTRKDRKQKMKRQARKKNFPVSFIQAEENSKHPNLAKFASHLKCIRQARKRRAKSVIIFEDDALILTPRFGIPDPPDKWDMLYMGGNIQSVLQDDDTDESEAWKRCCVLLTQCYIVHSAAYDVLLKEGRAVLKAAQAAGGEEADALNYDEWLCREMHPKLKVYRAMPERVIQRDGYSDVKGRNLNYTQQLTAGLGGVAKGRGGAVGETPTELAKPNQVVETLEDGTSVCRIALPDVSEDDLPKIALVSCVRNCTELFELLMFSYYRINYPRHKLQWLIADDSDEDKKLAWMIDGEDQSIKYINCKTGRKGAFLGISKKLNACLANASPDTEYVLHFQPDCYHQPESVLSRVRLLLGHPERDCIGSTLHGVFDISSGKSWEQFYPDAAGNRTLLFGPTLSYKMSFWRDRQFDENRFTFETFYFVRGRWDCVMEIPYNFALTALTFDGHKTGDAGRYYGIDGLATTSSVTGTGQQRSSTAVAKHRNYKHLQDGGLGEKTGATFAMRENDEKKPLSFSDEWDNTAQEMMLMLRTLLSDETSLPERNDMKIE